MSQLDGDASTLSIQLQPAQMYENLPVTLEGKAIRVLDILADEDGATLQGTLRVVDLKTNPKFAALSYVWGPNSNPQDVIICNQCRIPLTASCNDALRSLRKLYGGITIWVDSVCINQNDNDEKARQIPLMEDIYTWAVEVYIWLGPGTKTSDEALSNLLHASNFRLPLAGVPWYNADILQSPKMSKRMLLWKMIKGWYAVKFLCMYLP